MKFRQLLILVLTLTIIGPATANTNFKVGGNRPVTVYLPDSLTNPAPLLILLHSASTSGEQQERYMQLGPTAKKNGIIYIAPNGIVNPEGKRFWNASQSCCNKYKQEVDDVAYINSLIDEISAKTPVDPRRIYLIGHSNGAFMAYTLACQTRRIAAIVAIAGAMDSDTKCGFRTPVSLLNIHGTLDRTIKFSGGVLNDHPYTSAQQTVETIATTNECTPAGITKKDFEPTIKGHETLVTHYTCQSQSQIQYWKIRGGSHSPKLPRDFAEQVITFLLQQSIQR